MAVLEMRTNASGKMPAYASKEETLESFVGLKNAIFICLFFWVPLLSLLLWSLKKQ
jgi:hypothetical protein